MVDDEQPAQGPARPARNRRAAAPAGAAGRLRTGRTGAAAEEPYPNGAGSPNGATVVPVDPAAPAAPQPAAPQAAPREPTAPAAPAGPPPGPWRERLARRLQTPAALLVLISLAIGVLAGGFAAFYEDSKPAMYKSTAVLLLDQEPAIAAAGDEGILAKLSRLRYKYVGIVQTVVFAQPVAAQAGLPVGEVHAALSAGADLNSLLVSVAATMHSPQQARLVAQLAAEHLVTYLRQEQVQADVKPVDQATFSVVSPASTPVQTAPNHRRVLLAGVVVFAGITVVGALGADLLRRRS